MRILLGSICLALVGCGQEMAKQPSYRPLRASSFFADGRSARPLVPGTIARGRLEDDAHLHTGTLPSETRTLLLAGGVVGDPLHALASAVDVPLYADAFPLPITTATLERGQQRYDIYCAVCHDRAGHGRGMIVQRGFTAPPSYHTDWARGYLLKGSRVKLRDAPAGYYFSVITRGFGAMPDYAEQVAVPDRWAIIAYIRALQLSQHATLADVPAAAAKQLLRETP